MAYIFVSPAWFFGYDVILELLFAIVTFLVSVYAWRSFKLTGERNIRLFSMAFFFISFSYIIQSILNFIIMKQLDARVINIVHLQNVYLLNLFGIYMHAILFLIGLLLLAYIALRIYSLQTFVLLFILVFTSLYFSPYKTFMLYLLSTVLLGFIGYYYLTNYWNNRKATTLLVAIAMVFLFIGYLFFIFAMDYSLYYIMGHVLELAAYVMVLVNLIIISRLGVQRRGLKDGKKAR